MKTRILGFVALGAVAAMVAIALFVVPADLNQGDAQRIMYPHVASAWLAYLSFGVTAVSGILWLWKRDLRFDAVAVSGAEIGVMFTAFAIWGGMMWGRPIWGVFWQWEDPRLTTTTVLLLIYIGYLSVRRAVDNPARRARWAALPAESSPNASRPATRISSIQSGCAISRASGPATGSGGATASRSHPRPVACTI